MPINIPINSPLYRNLDVISCGCPAPINIPLYDFFRFSFPDIDSVNNDMYVIKLNYPIGEYPYAYLYADPYGLDQPLNYFIIDNFGDSGGQIWSPTGERIAFGFTFPKCDIPISISKAIYDSGNITNIEEVQGTELNVKFVSDNICTPLIKLEYKLSCDQDVFYTYYFRGVITRKPAIIKDDEYAFAQSGLEQRVYSNIVNPITITSAPISFFEHNFISYIFNDSKEFLVNGKSYSVFNNNIYNANSSKTAYTTGSITLIESVVNQNICCD